MVIRLDRISREHSTSATTKDAFYLSWMQVGTEAPSLRWQRSRESMRLSSYEGDLQEMGNVANELSLSFPSRCLSLSLGKYAFSCLNIYREKHERTTDRVESVTGMQSDATENEEGALVFVNIYGLISLDLFISFLFFFSYVFRHSISTNLVILFSFISRFLLLYWIQSNPESYKSARRSQKQMDFSCRKTERESRCKWNTLL